MAELVNLAVETVSRLERGTAIPSLKTLDRIKRALEVPLKDFFDFDSPAKKKQSPLEDEVNKLSSLLRTRKVEDVKLAREILKKVFRNVDEHYRSKR